MLSGTLGALPSSNGHPSSSSRPESESCTLVAALVAAVVASVSSVVSAGLPSLLARLLTCMHHALLCFPSIHHGMMGKIVEYRTVCAHLPCPLGPGQAVCHHKKNMWLLHHAQSSCGFCQHA